MRSNNFIAMLSSSILDTVFLHHLLCIVDACISKINGFTVGRMFALSNEIFIASRSFVLSTVFVLSMYCNRKSKRRCGQIYRVLDDEGMQNLMESIKDRGVITPAMVRKKDDGRYEMISGHRRKHASERF